MVVALTMADTEFHITDSTKAVYHVPSISNAAANKTALLLHRNHHEFNIFWNHKTYHNHQVHYLLTAFALGANPAQLQIAFDGNTTYQRSRIPVDEILVGKLHDFRGYF